MNKGARYTIRQTLDEVLADEDSDEAPALEAVMAKFGRKHVRNWEECQLSRTANSAYAVQAVDPKHTRD